MNPKIEVEKGFNVLLYVASALEGKGNLYKVLKAIYSADKRHLERYGRQLFRQGYQKLKFGNVPAYSYDVLTHCRDGKAQPKMPERAKQRIKVDKATDTVTPVDKADLKYLSKSEIECLDVAIAEIKPLSFNQVKALMHDGDPAYKNDVEINQFLSLEKHIIPTLKDGDKILEYLKDPHPG